jgi:hypothetical protein
MVFHAKRGSVNTASAHTKVNAKASTVRGGRSVI